MALIPTLWGPQNGSLRPPACIHSRSHDQSVVNNILELVTQIHHPIHNEYKGYTTGRMTQSKTTATQGRKTHNTAEDYKHTSGKAQVTP